MAPMRLAQLPTLAATIVSAPFEDVRAYFRAFFFGLNETLRALDCEQPGSGNRAYTEVTGDAVRAAPYFGFCGPTYKPKHPAFHAFYPLWGYERISRISSQPDMTLVEGMNGSNVILTAEKLAIFLQAPVYTVFSRIAWSPTDCGSMMNAPDMPKTPPGAHVFRALAADYQKFEELSFDNRDRAVAVQHDGRRWRFDQRGQPCAFEQLDAYGRRPIRDRLTRDIICGYLDALGIDPEATFGRRELADATLYSSEGTGMAVPPPACDRYARLFD